MKLSKFVQVIKWEKKYQKAVGVEDKWAKLKVMRWKHLHGTCD